MTTFAVGQRVHVEFDGVITVTHGTPGGYVQDHEDRQMYVPYAYMTALNPAHWPPVPGDIWELDGQEYAIREARQPYHKLVAFNLTDHHDAPAFPDTDARFNQAKLIRRRGGFLK